MVFRDYRTGMVTVKIIYRPYFHYSIPSLPNSLNNVVDFSIVVKLMEQEKSLQQALSDIINSQ
jgi:hypothetical protein